MERSVCLVGKMARKVIGINVPRTFLRFLIWPVFCLLVSCKNPVSAQKVIILIDDYLIDGGKYVFYWDGKNEDKQYVEPGDYVVVLEIKDWQQQEIITAIKGGSPGENNQSHFEPGFWQYPELLEPFPNPFKVQSGVNIPILLPGSSRVRITIFKG